MSAAPATERSRLPHSLRLAAAAALAACSALPREAPAPVAAEASQALVEAHALLRSAEPGSAERARAAAERARDLAPDWVAPRRLLDDLARADLLGVEALSAHLAELERDPRDARAHYLAGRLSGRDGGAHFRRAFELDPGLAWAHHGMAWEAGLRGRLDEAVARERDALARARDAWERSYFTSALARFLAVRGERDAARALLQDRLGQADVTPSDRVALGVQAVLLGLDTPDGGVRFASYARGLELLREGDLGADELERLVRRMRQVGSSEDAEELALCSALAARSTPERDRLRAEILLYVEPSPLALGLLERSFRAAGRELPEGPLMRAARFAAAQFAEAVETWRRELPDAVLDAEGVPRDERLRAVVEAARALAADAEVQPGARAPSERLADLGEALLAAGWFREARSVAGWLAAQDLDRALAIEERALAGAELLQSLRRLVYDLDVGSADQLASRARAASADGEESIPARDGGVRRVRPIRDLDGFLAATAPLFARANARLGGETDVERLSGELVGSPRMRYGPIGALVHPGPRFSAADERHGLGARGARVPGLAQEMERVARFALVGEVLGGGGPDAAVLARLAAEEEHGELLGVPWSGTVVWCEGSDVLGRASRGGARIAGAALHEGYWVDVDAVREERAAWDDLRRSFADGPRERVERVLASRGFPLASSAPERQRRERRRAGALLDEAERVRLAVLDGRRDDEGRLGRVTLDELVDATAAHERGHLTDRTRLLPIGHNLGAVLGLVLSAGFSPRRILERLEYRAQLVALCAADEPRIALTQVLDAAEHGSGGGTAHASAYVGLLDDLLETLDRELARAPAAWPEIDPGRTLVHQLHHLGPERVRGLALALAARRGLVAD